MTAVSSVGSNSVATGTQGVPDATPSIVAMIQALIAMEGVISNVLGNNSKFELQVQNANAEATKAAGEKVLKEVEQAAADADSSSGWGLFGEIFGWVAAALTTVLSFGTLSFVAAAAVAAFTVSMQSGAFNGVLDKISGGQGWAKDLVTIGFTVGVSIGAGLAAEASAAVVNAAKSAVADGASEVVSSQASTVSRLVFAQAIGMYGPQAFQDLFNEMGFPSWMSEMLAMGIAFGLSTVAMNSAFKSGGFEISGPKGISPEVLAKIRKMAMAGQTVANLSSTGFNTAAGVYKIKGSEVVSEEAATLAAQDFLKAFTNIFSQLISRNSQETTQTIQGFESVNNKFNQLMAPLQAAAKVSGLF